MYLAEISSAKIRGSLVSLQQLSITFGVSETFSTEVMLDTAECRFLLAVRDSLLSYISTCSNVHYSKTGLHMARHISGGPDVLLTYHTPERF